MILGDYPGTTDQIEAIFAYPGTVCGLAQEDRDLRAEADDREACLKAAAKVMLDLYPPARYDVSPATETRLAVVKFVHCIQN
jgi:hypothetical protein